MEDVKLALAAMYLGGDAARRKEAVSFLEDFQKLPHAWEIAHSLATGAEKPEYRLFAAQTLRSKAKLDMQQLPPSAYKPLRDLMLEILSRSSEKLVCTQLCLALAQIALQDLQWANCVEEVIARLSEAVPALLMFLKVLPEELSEGNKSTLTDDEFNKRTSEIITNNVEPVLLLLKNLASHYQLASLDCLKSWIKECPVESILKVDVFVDLIFKSLTNESSFERAADCLCTVLRETRDIDNEQLIEALYQQVIQVHSFYNFSNVDPDTFESLVKLYVEACELWHVLIAKNPAHFKPLVEVLVQCCKYKEDLDIVKYTFLFWYQLKQMLMLPRFEESRREFQSVYLELISVIIEQLKYPEHGFDDREQEDKFKDFRYEMGDVLKDCCAVMGAQAALNVPFQELQVALTQQALWPRLEAPLFSMRVMAKEVPLTEKSILPVIMQLLVQLPEHPKVRYATTLVLGRYSQWTSKHPEHLEVQLNYIIGGLKTESSEIISAVAQALMYFCQDCAAELVPYMEQLYMIFQQMQGHADEKATNDLADGAAHVIRATTAEQQYKTLENFLQPTVNVLSSSAKSDSLSAALDAVSVFFNILRCNETAGEFPPAQYFINVVWPLVSGVLSRFGQDLKISEHGIKVIERAVRGCSMHLSPILALISTLLCEGFRKTSFGCYLWASGVLIREFSDDPASPEAQHIVYGIGLQQSAEFFAFLTTHLTLDIRSVPDIIEDYFHMASDLLMHFPLQTVSNRELMESVLQAGLVALRTSEEQNPLRACVQFFVDYVSWGLPYPPVLLFDEDTKPLQEAVCLFIAEEKHGGALTCVVMEGLIFKFFNDPDGNDLLLKLLTVAPLDLGVRWLQEAAIALPNVGLKEVEKLMGSVNEALPTKDKRKIRMAINDFVEWYAKRNLTSRSTLIGNA